MRRSATVFIIVLFIIFSVSTAFLKRRDLVNFLIKGAISEYRKSYGVSLDFSEVTLRGFRELYFKKVKIKARRDTVLDSRGLLVGVKNLGFLGSGFEGDLTFTDVGINNLELIEALAHILNIEQGPLRSFNSLKCHLRSGKDFIEITGMEAVNDSMKIYASAGMRGSSIIDSSAKIYVLGSAFANIANLSGGASSENGTMLEAAKDFIFKKEADGWMSVNLKISGDLKKPSVILQGNSFKLEINSRAGSN